MNRIEQNINISKLNLEAIRAYYKALKSSGDQSEGRKKLPDFLFQLTGMRLDESEEILGAVEIIKSPKKVKASKLTKISSALQSKKHVEKADIISKKIQKEKVNSSSLER